MVCSDTYTLTNVAGINKSTAGMDILSVLLNLIFGLGGERIEEKTSSKILGNHMEERGLHGCSFTTKPSSLPGNFCPVANHCVAFRS